MYKQQSPLAASFKRTFSKDVQIEMLGVWDTVASVGFLIPQKLPFTSSDTIKTFRHAVSLDEHRTKWGVTLWEPEQEDGKYGSLNTADRSVEEVWFSGVHSDVGGGSEVDNARICLANIPLRWMLHEIVKAECGILFDNAELDRLGIPYDCVPRTKEGFKSPRGGTRDVHSDTSSYFAPNEVVQEVSEVISRLANGKILSGAPAETSSSRKGKSSAVASGGGRPILSWKEADEEDAVAALNDQLKIHPLLWLVQIPVWDSKRFVLLAFLSAKVLTFPSGRDSISQVAAGSLLTRMREEFAIPSIGPLWSASKGSKATPLVPTSRKVGKPSTLSRREATIE
ncbi:hypothetical protein FRC18_007956 [Serendipita sp. 400]|nr:hypothetical protein FRC18_007956 [Serendipita sp. 400]